MAIPPGYGDDPYTARAAALIREVFETKCEVFSNGAKVLSPAQATASLTFNPLSIPVLKRSGGRKSFGLQERGSLTCGS